jgi:hypothetical protein
VDHAERLTVVGSDTDFQPMGAGVSIGDGTTHFEAPDLTSEYSVLDVDQRTGLHDQTSKLLMLGRHRSWGEVRFGHRAQKTSIVAMPDLDRKRELLGATREHTRGG